MDYRKFTKKDLADILDVIQAAVVCRTEADLRGVTQKVKDMVCAEHAICGLGTVDSGSLTRVTRIINVDYPGEWMMLYAGGELYKTDPIVSYNCRTFRPFFWREAQREFTESPHRDFMKSAFDFGLKHGVTSGVNEPARKRGSLFSFSGDRDRFGEYHKNMLDILTPHIHQALVRISEVKKGAVEELSGREKEVLEWMKEGKTNWEISIILNISERTVKFHIQNISRKLDAVNKAHAVAIAMDGGLVG